MNPFTVFRDQITVIAPMVAIIGLVGCTTLYPTTQTLRNETTFSKVAIIDRPMADLFQLLSRQMDHCISSPSMVRVSSNMIGEQAWIAAAFTTTHINGYFTLIDLKPMDSQSTKVTSYANNFAWAERMRIDMDNWLNGIDICYGSDSRSG